MWAYCAWKSNTTGNKAAINLTLASWFTQSFKLVLNVFVILVRHWVLGLSLYNELLSAVPINASYHYFTTLIVCNYHLFMCRYYTMWFTFKHYEYSVYNSLITQWHYAKGRTSWFINISTQYCLMLLYPMLISWYYLQNILWLKKPDSPWWFSC